MLFIACVTLKLFLLLTITQRLPKVNRKEPVFEIRVWILMWSSLSFLARAAKFPWLQSIWHSLNTKLLFWIFLALGIVQCCSLLCTCTARGTSCCFEWLLANLWIGTSEVDHCPQHLSHVSPVEPHGHVCWGSRDQFTRNYQTRENTERGLLVALKPPVSQQSRRGDCTAWQRKEVKTQKAMAGEQAKLSHSIFYCRWKALCSWSNRQRLYCRSKQK